MKNFSVSKLVAFRPVPDIRADAIAPEDSPERYCVRDVACDLLLHENLSGTVGIAVRVANYVRNSGAVVLLFCVQGENHPEGGMCWAVFVGYAGDTGLYFQPEHASRDFPQFLNRYSISPRKPLLHFASEAEAVRAAAWECLFLPPRPGVPWLGRYERWQDRLSYYRWLGTHGFKAHGNIYVSPLVELEEWAVNQPQAETSHEFIA